MPAIEAASDFTAIQIAELLVAELEQAAEREEFGVIVQDVIPLDLPTLADALAHPKFTRSPRLRVAIVGASEVVDGALARHSSLAGLISAK
jgi:hypothetical protein